MHRARRHRRFLLSLLLVGVLFFSALSARPVHAFLGVGDQSFATTIADIPRSIFQAVTKAYDAIKSKVKIATDIAFKNGANTFISTVTQQFATSLATAGPGQKPLFLTNPTTFFRDVENAAAGDFLDSFSRGLTGASFNQRGQLVGGTGVSSSLGISGQSKVIITRLLRAGSDATGAACQQDCQNGLGAGINPTPALNVGNFSSGSLSDVPGNNDNDRGINLLTSEINGGISAKAKDEATKNDQTVCPNVAATLGPGPSTWLFSFQSCAGGGALPASCTMSYIDCYNHLLDAINNLHGDATTNVNQCLRQCKTGVGGAIRSSISGTSASGLFSTLDSIKNGTLDIRTSPAAIANKLSADKSDFGQFFQAAALLTATTQEKVLGQQTKLNSGVLPRTSKVSDQVLSPSQATSALFGVPFSSQDGSLTYTGTGAADLLKGIASFINSPVGKALRVYFSSRCGLNPDACKGPSNAQSEIGKILFGSGAPTGVAGAQSQLATLGTVDIISGDPGKNQVDVTSQLSSAGLIDSQFVTAIQEQDTVQDALSKGLLDGKRTVGFDSNGLEPTNGYPFRALQYLRKYRIIPVGWELAAQYAQKFQSQNLTLNFLTQQYDMCSQDDKHKVCTKSLKSCAQDTECGVDEGTCGASPYCGLVDPTWVLKAPQTYCRRQGAGEDILSKEFVCDQNNVDKVTGAVIPSGANPGDPNSQYKDDQGPPNCVAEPTTNKYPDLGHWVISRDTNTCADTQSCVAENDDGTCVAYGYCVQEKNTIKFNGTQCDVQNVSCTTYTDSEGQDISYLANTLDASSCTPGSAGCQWYCQKPSYDDATKKWTCTDTVGSKTYFTGQVQSCNQGSVGCQQFIKIAPGTNLLSNSGFETYDVIPNVPASSPTSFPGWASGLVSMVPTPADDATVTVGNATAVSVTAPSPNATISQTVQLGASLQERTFTGSVRLKSATACSATLRLCVGTDCSVVGAVRSQAAQNVQTGWSTGGVQLSIPSAAERVVSDTQLTFDIQPGGCAGSGLEIDSAQLEEVAGLTDYKAYGTTNVTYLNGQRNYCSASDVGCQAYTPTSGGTVVDAIANASNRCSADSVGCQLIHRQAITSLPYRDYNPAAPATSGADVTVISSKGAQCTAADVGCEEYTNLDTVAKGGEAKEYYSAVKQCVTPTNPVNKSTYYTWVGDAVKGFSLQSYQLVNSTAGAGPCMHLGVGTSTADPVCEDTAATIVAGSCTQAAMATNPDCTQYYDQNLNIYYRLKSLTVSVTADCHPYRNTIDQTDAQYAANKDNVYYLAPKENQKCSAAAASCRAFTGNTGGASHDVFSDSINSTSLNRWVGGDLTTASTQAGGQSMQITPNGPNGVMFTAAGLLKGKLVTGKTYTVTFTLAGAPDPDGSAPAATPHVRAFIGTGTDATGNFDGPSTGAFQSGLGVSALWDTSTADATAVPPNIGRPEWHTYTVGPLTFGGDALTDWRLGIIADGGSVYIDNIHLTLVQGATYMKNNTAPACPAADVGCQAYTTRAKTTEYLKSFTRLCDQAAVGCMAMIDTQNSSTPFSQTTKGIITPADTVVTVVDDTSLQCAASAKGCQMVGKPKYIRDGSLSGFDTKYLINDPDRYDTDLCTANQNMCRLYTLTDGSAVVFKDPGTNTCEYVTTKGGAGHWYISGTTIPCAATAPVAVQPVGASCSPVCQGGTRAGKACGIPTTDATLNAIECPGNGRCVGDLASAGRIIQGSGTVIGQCSSNTQCSGGNACVYQAGVCPSTQNGCNMYRDPSNPDGCQSSCSLELQGGSPIYVDSTCTKTFCQHQLGQPVGAHEGQNCQNSQQCGAGSVCLGADASTPTTGAPGCQAYTYLKQTVEDTAGTCNGQVDVKNGCLPFNDTSIPSLNFRGQ